MTETFSLREDPRAHERLQAWRRKHPRGFLINRTAAGAGTVHRTECRHLGGADMKADTGGNLSRQEKICSDSVGELRAWAARNEVKLRPCADCQPSETEALLARAADLAEAEGAFNPELVEDARDRVLSTIVRRQGQPAFRNALLELYGGRCAFSECDVEQVLDAAHIIPYQGPRTNHSQNGLLLRTDLHTLFDLGLLAVDADAMTILVSDVLAKTAYHKLSGRRVQVPSKASGRPSRKALEEHRAKAGL